ncbi:MAG: hypothetical protein HY870_06720 [Chloroflexi bacterium]|nr:hypothetical protein [Chloroflexota bacterium]
MTLLIPPEYVNVIAGTVYDADLPAALFQAYCRIVGLAWRDKRHQQLPPATVAELAVYLHCSERSAWGHLIALRKRGLISWTTMHGIVKIRINTALTESPVSLQTFAVSNDHVVVDPDQDQALVIQQQQSDQSLLQNFAVTTDPDPLQNFAVAANLNVLQKFAVDIEAAEAQTVAGLPHVTPELIQAWGEYLQGRPQVYNLPGLLLYTLRTTHQLPRAEGRGGSRRKTAPSPEQLKLPTAEQAALPDEVQTKLDQLGWNGDAAEIAEVHQSDPQRVQAWLDYALAQTAARSRAGLFRTGLRSQTLPPTSRATTSTTTGRYVTDELLFTQPESLTRSPQP